MTNPGEITDVVRHHLRQRFTSLGADPAAQLHESLLIRGGFYCGRRFQCDGMQAVWFVEEQQLKLFDRDGCLVQTEPAPTPARASRSNAA